MPAPKEMDSALTNLPLRIGAYVPDDLLEDWFAPGTGMNPPLKNRLGRGGGLWAAVRMRIQVLSRAKGRGLLEMGTSHMNEGNLEAKAITAVVEELQRQAAENPSKLQIRRVGDKLAINGEIDVDALVMVVVGSMAGGP